VSDPDAGETVAVGRCPDHGIVWGAEADVIFPVVAECNRRDECGQDLDQAGFAPLTEVKELVQ